jgi:hypothetical protein
LTLHPSSPIELRAREIGSANKRSDSTGAGLDTQQRGLEWFLPLEITVRPTQTLRARANRTLGFDLHLLVNGSVNAQASSCELTLSNSIDEFLTNRCEQIGMRPQATRSRAEFRVGRCSAIALVLVDPFFIEHDPENRVAPLLCNA